MTSASLRIGKRFAQDDKRFAQMTSASVQVNKRAVRMKASVTTTFVMLSEAKHLDDSRPHGARRKRR
jgi:hypothetical protein